MWGAGEGGLSEGDVTPPKLYCGDAHGFICRLRLSVQSMIPSEGLTFVVSIPICNDGIQLHKSVF